MAKKVIKRKVASKGVQLSIKNLQNLVDKVGKTTQLVEYPDFAAGDTVKVHVRIKEGDKERIQAYEGLVIGLYNKGSSRSFAVRKISHGVGVERTFLMSSPKVAKVDVLERGKVRRSKLYYIRKLVGKAAKIEREVETQTSAQQAANAVTKKAK
jgi:large subunit ribosomal protein L19